MVNAYNISYSFPQKDLYNDISFTLEDGQHCAFIGTNGSGKSTLINMIMDPEKYLFDGKLELNPNCRIGYVSQFSLRDKSKEISVFDYIAENFIKLQCELDSICSEMETSLELDSLLEKYQQTLDAFNSIGGNDFESTINKKLNLANLGMHKNLSISGLSGGEFKLVQVIKEMLKRPDLLIMDEPDAYLDFENINSLKNLINSHKETLLIITHNRHLLNNCFDKILHLEDTSLQEFDGSYADYNLSLLEKKIELQELASADVEEIERNDILINKLRYRATYNSESSNGRALNARVKIQERLESRKVKYPFVDIKQPNINFPVANILEDSIVLEVHDYSLAFDDNLLENINFEIKSTDKVALVGPNGTGKTTLLREIFKNTHASIHINENVCMSYLSQLQGETLNESNTLFAEFLDCGFETFQDVSAYLSGYGFEEEILNQTIGSLSGGEKSMLQLAKVATTHGNLLLLDEPGSHLDTYSQIALEHALTNYEGGLLMVSHDFYSIVNCTDFVLLIDNKTIRKISTRKFKKMVYSNYFDFNYLATEEKKKDIESKIALALKETDFVLAKKLFEELKS